jgi:hypothetical protein
MTRNESVRALMLAACVAVSASCAHAVFRRSLGAGRWQDAAAAFRADSGLQRDAEALRQVARIHAVPDSATWDPDRALELLGRSRAYTPRGHFPDADDRLEKMLRYVVRERAARAEQAAALRDSIVRITDDASRLRKELAQVRETNSAYEAERELSQRMVTRLESDLRDREAQLAAFRSELDRLKEIDLARSSIKPPG